MKLTELLGPAAVNGLHVVATDERGLCHLGDALAAAHPDAAIRTIRGRKSRTKAAFFDESAAALQFAYYFGENWDAFHDIFGEQEIFSATALVLLFSSADQLLIEATPRDLAILIEEIAEGLDRSRKLGHPFHVVLQCAADALPAMTARLAEANASFDTIDPA